MGPTWKSVGLAVVAGFATMCSAHGQLIPLLANAKVCACLARSYSAIPGSSRQSVSPDDPRFAGADRREAAGPTGLEIVSYVAGLELLLAVMAAIGSLLALALAGVVVTVRWGGHATAVPVTSSPGPFVFVPAKKLQV
jgi:hypothetical protein